MLVDSANNYRTYRAELATVESVEPAVPYLGLITAAVTFIADGNATRIDGLINREKVHLMWSVLKQFFALSKNVYGLLDSLPLQHWLLGELSQRELTEEELYELSYQRKPLADSTAH